VHAFFARRLRFQLTQCVTGNPNEKAQYPHQMHTRRQGPNCPEIFCRGGHPLAGELTLQKPNPHRILNRLHLSYSLNPGTTEF